ncbi:MAG TPA: SCO family protein [Chloroflexota bacterium]|jgi:protein SCO1|nr:SCO family protein [Chloroflexota bacterium]
MDVFGATPAFTLTDQTGAPFASQALAGRVTLLDFVYTHCTDACPLLSATFQETQRKLAADKLLGSRIMLVSLSVDPQHDTPPVLAEYGQQFKADPSGWKMLTGDWDQVYDVVTGFKLATRPPRPAADAPAPGGTELSHTTRVVLIDPQLQVRAYLDGADATADDLIAAARRLLK